MFYFCFKTKNFTKNMIHYLGTSIINNVKCHYFYDSVEDMYMFRFDNLTRGHRYISDTKHEVISLYETSILDDIIKKNNEIVFINGNPISYNLDRLKEIVLSKILENI